MNCTCRNSLLLIVSSFIFTHCTKSTNNGGGNTIHPYDTLIFIAGNNGTNPILWKNGIPDTLSQTTGSAYQILWSGDLYVTGIIQETGMPGAKTGQYVYWKDGSPVHIGSFGNVAYPPSIAVSGPDVYYANGYSGWKNGTMYPLPGIPTDSAFSQGSVKATFATGYDVYFAGTDSNANAVVWKNANMGIVSAYNRFSSNDAPIVSCLYVGTDVYVGGMLHTGVYWKNGTPNYLPHLSDGSFVPDINSILVVENVFSTGQILQLGNHTLGPAYWKDTLEQDLQVNTPTSDVTTYTTTCVCVSGTDTYVAGYSSTYTTPQSAPLDSAIYWKNGIEISLHSSGRAYSIVAN